MVNSRKKENIRKFFKLNYSEFVLKIIQRQILIFLAICLRISHDFGVFAQRCRRLWCVPWPFRACPSAWVNQAVLDHDGWAKLQSP